MDIDGGFWSDGAFETAEAPVICNINGTDLDHRQQITQITEQHVSFGPNLNGVNEMVNNPEVKNSSSHTKKRKLRSKVWDEFTKHEEVDGKKWAVCNHCNKKFDGSSKKGTTHLRNHLDRCKTKTSNPGRSSAADKTERSNPGGSSAADKTERSNPGGSSAADKTGDSLTTATTTTSASADIIIKGKSKIDEELNELDKKRMIIKNWVPLDSIKRDLLEVFEEEKQKLKRYFEKLPYHFSLSIKRSDDCNYFYVSVHFIDDNWKLKKKVIYVDIKGGYRFLDEDMKLMVEEWNIDKKICSIVADKDYDEMEEWVSERGSLPYAGTFYGLSCLSRMFRQWDRHGHQIMIKMLTLKEYVLSNENNNNNKFEKAVNKAAAANLRGFELLEWAVALKEAFWELEHIDPIGFIPFKLTKEEWDDATAMYKFLKEYGDVVKSLPDGEFTTPNVYFPKICHLYTKMLQGQKSDNVSIREIAVVMRECGFDYCWTNSNLVLTIVVILDPRFKLDIVKCWYEEIYDNHDINIHLKEIIDVVINIYNGYAKVTENFKTSTMLDRMGRPCISVCHVEDIASIRLELDRYLKDSKFPVIEEFDILAWWNLNSPIYPTLARMARDYLAIPIGIGNCLSSSLLDEIDNILITTEGQDDDITRALVLTKVWLHGS